MRYIISLFFSIMLFSCTDPLEKSYSQASFSEDIIELKEIISESELDELHKYIEISLFLGVDINDKTYNDLLNDIKNAKINEDEAENSFVREDFKDLLNQRLENHMCDDFILEMNRKSGVKHNDHQNDSIEWDEESYFIHY